VATAKDNSLLDYAKKGLYKDIKESLYKNIVDELISDFEKQIRPIVKGRVDQIKLDINSYQDFASSCQHINVHTTFSDE